MKASANSGLGAQLTECEALSRGLRALAQLHTMSLCTAQKSPQSSPDLGSTKRLCRLLGHLQGACECLCDGTEGWPWRWTQSHSSAVRGEAPIQTRIPTEIQRPSCCERQTHTQGRTPTLHLALKRERWLCVALSARTGDTSGVGVCLKERNGQDYQAVVPA